MREIKFRVWDKENKEMLDVEALHWDDCTREFLIRTTMYSDYFTPEELMQFTGLYDKNGKEIYEGDIVKAKFFEKHITGEIEFALGAFFVTGSSVSDNQMFIFNDFEVVGNIYENPELLEVD